MHIFHKWSKWQLDSVTDILASSPKPWRDNNLIGTAIKQSRTCDVCGKVQYDYHKVML